MLKNKIVLPKNLTNKKIIDFFLKKGLYDLVTESNKQKRPINRLKWSKTLIPDLKDLYRIYQFIVLNKRTTVLEFGSGWSTLVIYLALNEVKKNFYKKADNLRRHNLFELLTVDNEKKYLNITKKRIKLFNKKNKTLSSVKVKYQYSECVMGKFQDNYCTYYKTIPLCNPDFIYLDGPNLWKVKKKINNFSTRHGDLMPMAADILRFENFLIPGTIILTDGRSANANFLKNFFKRKWIYQHDIKNDQHIFYCNDNSLGYVNDMQLKFYRS